MRTSCTSFPGLGSTLAPASGDCPWLPVKRAVLHRDVAGRRARRGRCGGCSGRRRRARSRARSPGSRSAGCRRSRSRAASRSRSGGRRASLAKMPTPQSGDARAAAHERAARDDHVPAARRRRGAGSAPRPRSRPTMTATPRSSRTSSLSSMPLVGLDPVRAGREAQHAAWRQGVHRRLDRGGVEGLPVAAGPEVAHREGRGRRRGGAFAGTRPGSTPGRRPARTPRRERCGRRSRDPPATRPGRWAGSPGRTSARRPASRASSRTARRGVASTASITRARSSSVRADPLGRHRPCPKRCSATAPPTRRAPAKTGCRCIGFHTGRASMFSALQREPDVLARWRRTPRGRSCSTVSQRVRPPVAAPRA